jgi:hypothetical protein
MWLSFNPDHSVVSDPKGWNLGNEVFCEFSNQTDVMGSAVNPYDVVANGSRHLHAIWSGGSLY